jgi:hypothetical protein
MRRPRLAFPPPTQSTHRRILLLSWRNHHPAFRGVPGSTTSRSKRHRMPMMRIRLRASPPRAALGRRRRRGAHTAITGAVHRGRRGRRRRASMSLPHRRVAIERYTSQPEPHHLGRLINVVAPRTHTRCDPCRMRRRGGRGWFVHRKRAFFMLQRRLGGLKSASMSISIAFVPYAYGSLRTSNATPTCSSSSCCCTSSLSGSSSSSSAVVSVVVKELWRLLVVVGILRSDLAALGNRTDFEVPKRSISSSS